MLFVPAALVKPAALEAIDAGVKLVVLVADRVPVWDAMEIAAAAKTKNANFVGPNTLGIASPGQGVVGMIGGRAESAREWFKPPLPGGTGVGVISRSGGMASSTAYYLGQAGVRISSIVHVGGDTVLGLRIPEVALLFEQDPATDAIAIFGEIGGSQEEDLAELMRTKKVTKPVVAYIGGKAAKSGTRFSHAGAIIEGNTGTHAGKVAALREAGATVVESFGDLPDATVEILRGRNSKSLMSDAERKAGLDQRDHQDRAEQSGGPRPRHRRLDGQDQLWRGRVSDPDRQNARREDRPADGCDSRLEHRSRLHAAELRWPLAPWPAPARRCRPLSRPASWRSTNIMAARSRIALAISAGCSQQIRFRVDRRDCHRRGRSDQIAGRTHSGLRTSIHTKDPRTARLFELAAEAGLTGGPATHIGAARAVERAFAAIGKPLPINVDGAIGAILADLGLDLRVFNGIFMIARTPGLVAHVTEEQTREKPMRRIDPVNHAYDGPIRMKPDSVLRSMWTRYGLFNRTDRRIISRSRCKSATPACATRSRPCGTSR